MPKQPKPSPQHAQLAHHDELPSIDTAALHRVTGGAGMDMSAMLPMLMIMKSRSAPAPVAAAPPAPPKPKIMLNGVEQPASALTSNGSSFETTV